MKGMKKLLTLVLSLFMAFSLCMTVCAEGEIVVAKIGDVEYETLQEALDAANNGDTIVLQDNITVTNLIVNGKKNEDETYEKRTFVLDMNGKTITQNYSGFATRKDFKQLLTVRNNVDLTITGNGKFVGPAGADAAKYDGKVLIEVRGADAKLTIVNGTFTAGGEGDSGLYGLYSRNGATIVLGDKDNKTGPTIHSYYAAIGMNNTTSPSYITVYGGTYEADMPTNDEDPYYYLVLLSMLQLLLI